MLGDKDQQRLIMIGVHVDDYDSLNFQGFFKLSLSLSLSVFFLNSIKVRCYLLVCNKFLLPHEKEGFPIHASDICASRPRMSELSISEFFPFEVIWESVDSIFYFNYFCFPFDIHVCWESSDFFNVRSFYNGDLIKFLASFSTRFDCS